MKRRENYIRVVALNEAGALAFVTEALGVPVRYITRVTDEGTPNDQERYRREARLFYVHLSPVASGVR